MLKKVVLLLLLTLPAAAESVRPWLQSLCGGQVAVYSAEVQPPQLQRESGQAIVYVRRGLRPERTHVTGLKIELRKVRGLWCIADIRERKDDSGLRQLAEHYLKFAQEH